MLKTNGCDILPVANGERRQSSPRAGPHSPTMMQAAIVPAVMAMVGHDHVRFPSPGHSRLGEGRQSSPRAGPHSPTMMQAAIVPAVLGTQEEAPAAPTIAAPTIAAPRAMPEKRKELARHMMVIAMRVTNTDTPAQAYACLRDGKATRDGDTYKVSMIQVYKEAGGNTKSSSASNTAYKLFNRSLKGLGDGVLSAPVATPSPKQATPKKRKATVQLVPVPAPLPTMLGEQSSNDDETDEQLDIISLLVELEEHEKSLLTQPRNLM
jgi:hypothetical protein